MGLALNLSDADTGGGFNALPSGTYNANILSATMEETKNEGKLPAGTPMINVEFEITDDLEVKTEEDGKEIAVKTLGRRAWRRFIIAPEKVNGKKYEHKDKMDGMLVRFFEAAGFDKEEIMSGTFEPDLEDLPGRPVRIVLKKRLREDNGEWTNDVAGVKPAMAESGLL